MGRHTPGTGGDARSADTVSDPPVPHTKLQVGADGTAVDVDATNPLPVTGVGTQDVNVVSPDPLPVSLPSDPLPVDIPHSSDEVSDPKILHTKIQVGVDGTAVDVDRTNPLPVLPIPGPVTNPGFWQFADVDGDGTGAFNATGDYSDGGLGLTEFGIQPGPGEIFDIARMIITIEDTGSFDSGSYGNNVTLTNGIAIEKRVGTINGASVLDQSLTGAQPIITNVGWGAYCFDVEVHTFGQGNEFLLARWTFLKAGVFLRLVGDDDEYFAVRLHDDFSGLVDHGFNLQGFIE